MKFLSIVIPCLNEAESLPFCLKKIFKILKKMKIEKKSEVILVDNGSVDDSVKIAKKFDIKIIYSPKGYGNALRKGIEYANGEYVVFADADNSYNFLELPKFINKAKMGYELIQGNRFEKYGGKIKPNAMPFSHQYIGNPFLSFLTKIFFQIKFNDVFCGFRMFKKKIYLKNFYFSNGMEFAVENLIKLEKSAKKSIEIPITLHKDKRSKTKSHLKTFSDGFKTLKFIIVHGIQMPSILFAMIFFGLSANSVLSNNFINITSVQNNYLYSQMYFCLSLQFVFFYFFSNLASQKLGFQKKGIANKIYKILSFNKSLIIIFITFVCTSSILLFLNFKNSDFLENIKYIIFLFFGVSIQCFVNVLMISILEYFGDKYK